MMYAGPLMVVLFSAVSAKNLLRTDKRSVFDLIAENKNNVENKDMDNRTIVLNNVVEDGTAIRYEYLKNMFHKSRRERRKAEKKNKIRKKKVKHHF